MRSAMKFPLNRATANQIRSTGLGRSAVGAKGDSCDPVLGCLLVGLCLCLVERLFSVMAMMTHKTHIIQLLKA